jgi:hypothetical protein
MAQSSDTLKESCAKARMTCRRKVSPVALSRPAREMFSAGIGNSIIGAAFFMGAENNSDWQFIKII